MQFKKKELEEYFDEFIQCYPWSEDVLTMQVRDDWDELHANAFNTEPYIIGRQKAIEWMGDKTWDIIKFVKDYEVDSYGVIMCDLTNPEQVVDMYAYIIGEEIVNKYIENKKKDIENKKKDIENKKKEFETWKLLRWEDEHHWRQHLFIQEDGLPNPDSWRREENRSILMEILRKRKKMFPNHFK